MERTGNMPKRFVREKLYLWKNKVGGYIDNFSVGKKLRLLYIFCVLIPLIITDSVILATILRYERNSDSYDMKNIASAVRYNITNTVNNAAAISSNLYQSRYINDFLEQKYTSTLDYFEAYQELLSNMLLLKGLLTEWNSLVLYGDNTTIVNGGHLSRLDREKKEELWYRRLAESGRDQMFVVYFDNSSEPAVGGKRKLSFVRRLNFYQYKSSEKLVKIDLNYTKLAESLGKMNYDLPVYVCSEGKIILSNRGYSSIRLDFSLWKEGKQKGYEETFRLYGQELTIIVWPPEQSTAVFLRENASVILLLVLVNALIPSLLMGFLRTSFTQRLQELSEAFQSGEDEVLTQVEKVRGKDEIGILMKNYNRMAERMNELIQTVYKDKLKEQEFNIARQKAELLALHSQINPHFLFNALESIRMHSVLKGEAETARIVEKLAVMQRQYVDWGSDFVTIEEEMGFAEAYLELQKYRFGDRLSYVIELEDDCRNYMVPKISLVTFVENACVHGIEEKSSRGWVFVRAYRKENNLFLEIEDTGSGIEEPLLSELLENMRYAGIAALKKKGHVGIMNACIRLRIMTNDQTRFYLESEPGVGTIVTVKIPLREEGALDAEGIAGR